jgi:hypothetical protein
MPQHLVVESQVGHELLQSPVHVLEGLSRFASSDFIPPYWAHQRANVASLNSKACSTAARSLPAFSIASASRSFATICSGFLLLPSSGCHRKSPPPEAA